MHPLTLLLSLTFLPTALPQSPPLPPFSSSSSSHINCPTHPHKDTTIAILLQVKNTLHDPLNRLSNWNINPTHTSCNNYTAQVCKWNGVMCTKSGFQEVVSALSLGGFQLQGAIPPSLGHLSFLTSLDLSQNSFSGSIPSELTNCTLLEELDLPYNLLSGSIPGELGLLVNLRTLDLSYNQFSGHIPGELGLLVNLTSLDLFHNSFSGTIPWELANCTLDTLDLSHNLLSGSIPGELGLLVNLGTLDLSYNQFSGHIPSLGLLSFLTSLDLSHNSFSRTIPWELANCTLLVELNLSDNLLSGSIPAELGSSFLTNLYILDLSHNQFSGQIPGNVYSYLWYLDLSSNSLSGGIPSSIPNYTALYYLDLSSNQLTGSFPSKLTSNFTTLETLDLSYNLLSGSIHVELGSSLKTLNLSTNNLSGGLPPTLNFMDLYHIDLSSNQLTGSIPSTLIISTSLETLDLSHNLLSGSIPRLGSFLKSLDLSSNNLSGAIPENLGQLSMLQFVDLSHNLLNNSIPAQFPSLQQLVSLNLKSNDLSGSIPPALSGCLQLQSLDLSNNRLSGSIPQSLTNLDKLTRLDISYNNLQGPVPNMLALNNLAYIAGNPGLCGKILNRSCPRHKFVIDIVVPTTLVATLLLICLFWYWCCVRNKHEAGAFMSIVTNKEYCYLSANQVRETTNDFSEENVIGEGSVSIVYRAVLPGGKAVAVKVLKNEVLFWEESRFRKEVHLLSKVKHRNVVRVYGCCFNLDIRAIILQFFRGGNLKNYLHGRDNQELSMEEKLRILRGVGQGLAYLHHHHPDGAMVHCDIKPENILLDADLEPRIADFGIAKLLGGDEESSSALLLRGSVGYIPPEYGQNPKVSTKGDVYSYGVVMLEVLTNKSPTCTQFRDDVEGEDSSLVLWARSSYAHNIQAIFDTNAPPRTTTMSEQEATATRAAAAMRLARVALMCTHDLPSQRPTMLEITAFLRDFKEQDDAAASSSVLHPSLLTLSSPPSPLPLINSDSSSF